MVAVTASIVALLLLFAAIFALHLLPTRKGVMSVSGFMGRQTNGDEADEAERPTDHTNVSRALPSSEGKSQSRLAKAKDAVIRPSFGSRDAPSADDTAGGASAIASYEDLGQTIAKVLQSAQEEAESIRGKAQAEISELRTRFESEMAERRTQVRALKDEADRYAEERRQEADREAHRIQANAESEAKTRRKEAEVAKRRLEEEGLARQRELADASRALEEWLSNTVTALREVVAKVENMLAAPHGDLETTLLKQTHEAGREGDLHPTDAVSA